MNLAVTFYAIFFVVSVIIFLAVARPGSFNNIYQGYGVAMMVCANGGYLALCLSSNIKEAILATKITYVGGAFLPLLMFLIICDMCKIKLDRYLVHALYLFQIIIYISILTIGYSTRIYYKTVSYHRRNGYTYLGKTYGPMHKVFMLSLAGYFLATLVIVIYSLVKKRAVCRKDLFVVMIGFALGIGAYIAKTTAGIFMDIMPFVYVVVTLALIMPVRSSNIYTIDDKMERVTGQKSLEGYVTFDNKLRYMSSNETARRIFPELRDYSIDSVISDSDSVFYRDVILFIKNNLSTNIGATGYFTIDEYSYEIDLNEIKRPSGRKVGYAVRLSDITDRQKYINMVEKYNQTLETEVAEKTKRIRKIQQKTILGIAEMVESRDLSTGGHIKRTSEVVRIFSKELLKSDLGLSKDFLKYVKRSAPMHDLGKITVDDAILRKKGKYTLEEYNEMKRHAAAGAEIVNKILTGIEEEEFVTIASNIAHYHHEKYDGTGYPKGLSGKDIPIEARIMALADVFDALVSKRCYKEAFSIDKAFEIILNDSGTHFDPELVEVFVKCRPELERTYAGASDDED